MDNHVFTVDENSNGKRVDKFLATSLPECTRSFIQGIIKDHLVKVDNKVVKANFKLSIGQCVSISVPSPSIPDIVPEDIPLNIVYEDNHILIVSKPKNMVVHPAPGHYTGTLVNALMYHCKDDLSGINGVMRPGIVHRIDKDTTGLLVVSKNDMSHQSLATQLKEHSITRTYHLVVHGNIKTDEGTIDAPIGRHNINRKRMSTRSKNSREAITHYKVLERFGNYTYLECRLQTGRTHQIRVHLASIGHPILGDELYGFGKSPFKLEGQTLHAKTLGFTHPSSKVYVEFQDELPQYFVELIEKLRYNNR